ncbi:MAG: D-alanine--D-alanine ligase [Spirochaetes bacterium]|nr:D-alanine--D-alanine ligase [Spirochaetota bacterium]
MKVGITYDLRDYYIKEGYSLEETAEFDRTSTIDAIAETLKGLGFEIDRIGNDFELMKRLVNRERWDMVFNICEGLNGYGRESIVPALLENYKIPHVFSDPLTLAISLNKGMAKRIFKSFNIRTPDFYVLNDIEDIENIKIDYPLFAKPIGEGTGKGIGPDSKINNFNELKMVCNKLLKKYNQAVLVEKYLSGREFTVGIIGTGRDACSIGVMEVINKLDKENIYSYDNKEYCEEKVVYKFIEGEIAEKCKKISIEAWNSIECKDAGRVDVRMDEKGNINVLEINPLAGLHPDHSDLPIISKLAGISYKELIGRIMNSALKRYKLNV